jgi:hypothetical protein
VNEKISRVPLVHPPNSNDLKHNGKKSENTMKLSIAMAEFEKLMRSVLSRTPRSTAVLRIGACDGKVFLESGDSSAETEEAVIERDGAVTLAAGTFRALFQTFQGTVSLEIEGNPKSLRLNSFTMPISTWSDSPKLGNAISSMRASRIPIRLPRDELLAFGRGLKDSFTRDMVGDVTLVFSPGLLKISSYWGETEMPYEGTFSGTLILKESAFRSLISAHVKQKTSNPWINGAIDPNLHELSLAMAGARATFAQ